MSSKECTYPNHWLSKNFHGDLKKPSNDNRKTPTHWPSLMGIRRSWILSFICWMGAHPCADGGSLSGEGRATANVVLIPAVAGFDFWTALFLPLFVLWAAIPTNYTPAVLFKDSSSLSKPKLLHTSRRCDRNRKLFCSSWVLTPKSKNL